MWLTDAEYGKVARFDVMKAVVFMVQQKLTYDNF